MNTNTVTDGQLGQLAVKQNELFGRAKKGVYASFDEVLDALQLIIEGKASVIPILAVQLDATMSDVFLFTVDYGQSLEQMIAAGHYDRKNSDINAKRFQIEGQGKVEFEARYFHFNRDISSKNAVEGMESADTTNTWTPAKVEHVLSHGATFPEEQRKFPIVGLGSVAKVDGDRSVPYLDKDGSRRILRLAWWHGVWNPFYRFLAVRKVSGS